MSLCSTAAFAKAHPHKKQYVAKQPLRSWLLSVEGSCLLMILPCHGQVEHLLLSRSQVCHSRELMIATAPALHDTPCASLLQSLGKGYQHHMQSPYQVTCIRFVLNQMLLVACCDMVHVVHKYTWAWHEQGCNQCVSSPEVLWPLHDVSLLSWGATNGCVSSGMLGTVCFDTSLKRLTSMPPGW